MQRAMRALSPTMVSRRCAWSITLPFPIDTLGPTTDPVIVTPSSMYTGCTTCDRSIPAGTRARPFSSMARFVSSSVSSFPASYHPWTSITLILAPRSIMYWKASVR
ncbi:MAG TPA: hypothetical protein PKC83_12450 [Gemmatimonadaceae bacterium]|nr:hypothetical protein [Gemmatimonadaceae bacterium]